MEQTKGRRAFCIGLSILIALLVWFYANDDTEIEISVNDVPIEFTNEDTTLADKGSCFSRTRRRRSTSS